MTFSEVEVRPSIRSARDLHWCGVVSVALVGLDASAHGSQPLGQGLHDDRGFGHRLPVKEQAGGRFGLARLPHILQSCRILACVPDFQWVERPEPCQWLWDSFRVRARGRGDRGVGLTVFVRG